MKLIICEPGKPAKEKTVKEMISLKEMQEIVGGYIEVVTPDGVPAGVRLICNKEGKLLNLPTNRWISIHGQEDLIFGTFLFCAEGIADGEPDLVPLSEAQAEKLMRMLGNQAEPVRCVLCGEAVDTLDYNAAPLASGFCCKSCYEDRVCRERMKVSANEKPETKEVPRLLETIAGDICQYICKYRNQFKDEEELYTICETCPVSLLC